jgi:hypothetical protein
MANYQQIINAIQVNDTQFFITNIRTNPDFLSQSHKYYDISWSIMSTVTTLELIFKNVTILEELLNQNILHHTIIPDSYIYDNFNNIQILKTLIKVIPNNRWQTMTKNNKTIMETLVEHQYSSLQQEYIHLFMHFYNMGVKSSESLVYHFITNWNAAIVQFLINDDKNKTDKLKYNDLLQAQLNIYCNGVTVNEFIYEKKV